MARQDSALHAPGREILTLLPGGHYDFASGDSISTAQVTGVVALLLAKNRALSAAARYQLLRDTSTHAGAGRRRREHVDACAAVTALVRRGSCTSDADHRLADKKTSRRAAVSNMRGLLRSRRIGARCLDFSLSDMPPCREC